MFRRFAQTALIASMSAAVTVAGLAATDNLDPRRLVIPDRNYSSPADPGNPTAMRGCVIRFDQLSDSGRSVIPRIHANDTHHCVGVTSIRADWSSTSTRGDLVINNAAGPGTVVTITVSPDETMTARGIDCGASGGGTVTRIRCYNRDGEKVPAYSLDLYGPTVNLWVAWTMWMGQS